MYNFFFQSRPRAVDLTAEQLEQLHIALPQPSHAQHGKALSKQVFNLSHHRPVQLESVGLPPSALLKIILSYNPLWLMIGLETVNGELLPVNTNSDLLGLSRLLVMMILSNPGILAEFAHPAIPHC